MPKYSNEKKAILDLPLYEEKLNNRGRKSVTLRRPIDFMKIKDMQIQVIDETSWSYGDSLHKLSVKYYGVGIYYWVIGLVNNKPTDAHYEIGDTILIPGDPELIDSRMGVPDVKF